MDYQVFNKFQTEFFTSIERFKNNSNYTMKQYSFLLFNSIMKGLPHLADEVYNIYSPHVKALESPAIIIALQRRFVNGFSNSYVPKFVYYKGKTVRAVKEKTAKTKLKKGEVALQIFSSEVVEMLKTKLMYDSKTYDYLKFSPLVQKLGIELTKSINEKAV